MSSTDLIMGAAGASGAPATYVEDVFSTYLYTGTGAAQTINNGIDLAGKGGLVWFKRRNDAYNNNFYDTVRGTELSLLSNTTDANQLFSGSLTAFNASGFTVGSNNQVNEALGTYVSWTFRKAPKFFDVVTYTGTGATQNISHNLGSTPGFIITKVTSATGSWVCYHRSLGAGSRIALNATTASVADTNVWNNTSPTSSVFTVGASASSNVSGATYVAYLFAHDAGGFGAAGTDNVISCGSFTCDSSGNATVSLGYEPQYILYKSSSTLNDWRIFDVMRGLYSSASTSQATLSPNLSSAETSSGAIGINATGFNHANGGGANQTYIYMAIRRPMKPPTSGTEVFSPIANSDTTGVKQTTGFPVDLQVLGFRAATAAKNWMDRLRGISTTATNGGVNLQSTNNNAEFAATYTRAWDNTGYQTSGAYADTSVVGWNFRRATGFFDVVCYTGTQAIRTVPHNLGVAPELIIVKSRQYGLPWIVYNKTLGSNAYITLDQPSASSIYSGYWNNTQPTSTVFTVGADVEVNIGPLVAYLFASLPGVSKVGSYTGTGTTQTINCGFTGGARFVMVKATSTTGDWVVVDTARGLVSGNDPFLQLNSTAAEVTGEDILDPDSSGFVVNQTTESINASGVSYIFLAVA